MKKNANRPPEDTMTDKKGSFIERGIMPAIILTIITIISVALLALTENVTAEARAEQQRLIEDANKMIIFSEADSFPAEETDNAGASLPGGHGIDISAKDNIVEAVYLAKKDDTLLGFIVSVNSPGYGGSDVALMLGYDLEGNIVNLTIDASAQTAGLGSKVGDESFSNQLLNINAGDNLSTGSSGDVHIDAVSNATISSEAVVTGVNAANDAVRQMLGLE